MKITLSSDNAVVAGEFTMFLFNVRTMAHIMHLNTRSHATHSALDEFYKGIVDLTDRFAEAAAGRFKTIQWPAALGDGLRSVSGLEPVSYLEMVKNVIEKADDLIEADDLENILAEMLELTTKTLYKLGQQ